MLDIPSYDEVRDFIDHHRDMRLDIDHMSYEVNVVSPLACSYHDSTLTINADKVNYSEHTIGPPSLFLSFSHTIWIHLDVLEQLMDIGFKLSASLLHCFYLYCGVMRSMRIKFLDFL